MNAEPNMEDPGPEPEIIIIGIDRENYFLYKGDEHLNQILLADGEFPSPILCVHFKSAIDVKLMLGESVNISQHWGINPEIVDRLRNDENLIETDA